MSARDRRLLRSSRVARTHLGLAVALGFLAAAGTLAQALLLAHVVARVFLHGDSLGNVLIPLAGIVLAGLARGLAAWGFEASGRLGAARVMSDLRNRLARRLLEDGAPLANGMRSGELAATAVQGVDSLETYFARYLPQLVLAVLVPVAVLAWVARVDSVAAAILAATVPLIPFFMALIGRSAGRHARSRFRALEQLSGRFLDLVRGLPTLQAYNRAEAETESLRVAGERFRSTTMSTLRIAFLSALALELLAMLGTAMVAVVVGTRLAQGHPPTFEHALAILILAPELFLPLRQLGAQFHSAANGVAAAAPIFDLLDAPHIRSGLRPAASQQGTIRFEKVSYAYASRPELVLDGFDLALHPGECVALVGPSGAGKSTIASLLLRFVDPTSGAVRIGGHDLRELDLTEWRANLAWLPQRPHVFAGTVRENVTLADPAAHDLRIEAAIAAAGAGFVNELPHGLATEIGEGGSVLSAGEARRIALARALLRESQLLILDEPTAHLDAASAAGVADAIARISNARTTLLITHDESLARRADRVVVLGSPELAVAA